MLDQTTFCSSMQRTKSRLSGQSWWIFRMLFFFNPFFDLIYFFLLSVSADVLIPNYQPLLNRYHSSLVSTLTRLNSTHLHPSISDISKNIVHFAPMALPFVCGAIDVLSGVGNPDLNPELREGKFRSAVP